MSATAANLIERVLPPSTALRQWVLTFMGAKTGAVTAVRAAWPRAIARYLAAAGELIEVPSRSPGRGPPYWKSRVLRRQALGDGSDDADHGSKGDEAA